MANIYFAPGEQRAAKVEKLFARIAPRYDLLNDLQSFGLHRYWKREVIRLAQGRPGERALDLCCGTGDLTFALGRAKLQAIGLDFSSEMIAVAKAKTGKTSMRSTSGTPHFIRADAQNLPFRQSSFQILTIGYGLRNLADWRLGLAEMLRVLTPGGRLLVLDFGKPDNALWRGGYFSYLRLVVPVLGLLFCGSASAYAYILESLKHYPAQNGVAAAMRELGFIGVRIVSFLGGMMTINYGEKPAS
jgi:demethylmenaquinone methyltransferase/2-methoxy-6-polyprenyl-1,4-benzoquinol methylase